MNIPFERASIYNVKEGDILFGQYQDTTLEFYIAKLIRIQPQDKTLQLYRFDKVEGAGFLYNGISLWLCAHRGIMYSANMYVGALYKIKNLSELSIARSLISQQKLLEVI